MARRAAARAHPHTPANHTTLAKLANTKVRSGRGGAGRTAVAAGHFFLGQRRERHLRCQNHVTARESQCAAAQSSRDLRSHHRSPPGTAKQAHKTRAAGSCTAQGACARAGTGSTTRLHAVARTWAWSMVLGSRGLDVGSSFAGFAHAHSFGSGWQAARAYKGVVLAGGPHTALPRDALRGHPHRSPGAGRATSTESGMQTTLKRAEEPRFARPRAAKVDLTQA